jgi:hypothetical protein
MRRRDAGASEQEADAAGWGGLLDSLASLMSIDLPTDHGLAALPRPAADAGARRHAELGGALVRSLQGMMDVHASIEAASPCGLPKGCLPIDRIKAAELLPSHVLGAELGPLQLPLYEKVMPSQQAAAYAYLRAIADTGDAAAPPGSPGAVDADSLVALGDWSVCGPSNGGAPSPHSSAAEEQRPSLSSGQRPDAPGGGVSELRSSFKRLYMEMLTEGAADDLDNLRQAEALDEASLSLLVRLPAHPFCSKKSTHSRFVSHPHPFLSGLGSHSTRPYSLPPRAGALLNIPLPLRRWTRSRVAQIHSTMRRARSQ